MHPDPKVGAIGQVCQLSGSGGAPGKPPRFYLTAQSTARITKINGRLHEGRLFRMKKAWIFGAAPPPLGDYAASLLQANVQAVIPDTSLPDDLPTETFRAAILASLSNGALADELEGQAKFHHILLSATDNYQQLESFALCHLPMAATQRADLSAMDFAPRVRALLDQLTKTSSRGSKSHPNNRIGGEGSWTAPPEASK